MEITELGTMSNFYSLNQIKMHADYLYEPIQFSFVLKVLSNLSLILLETQGLLIAYGYTVPVLDAAFVIFLALAVMCWLTIILAMEYEKSIPAVRISYAGISTSPDNKGDEVDSVSLSTTLIHLLRKKLIVYGNT